MGTINLPEKVQQRAETRRPSPTTVKTSMAKSRQSGSQVVQFLTVIFGIRHHWKWALPLGIILGAAACTGVMMTEETEYRAKAWIQILSLQPYYVFKDQAEKYDSYVSTQFDLMRSPMVLEPVLGRPEIAGVHELAESEDPVDWLAKHLEFDGQGDSELYTIGITCGNPDDAANIVNAVVDSYFLLYHDESSERNRQMVNLLEEELARRTQIVEGYRDEIRDLTAQASDKGVLYPGKEGGQFPVLQMQSDLIMAEAELEALKAEIEIAKDMLQEGGPVPESMVEKAIDVDPVFQQMLAEKTQLQQNLSKTKEVVSDPESPHVQRLKRSMEQMEEEIAQMREDLREEKMLELKNRMRLDRQQEIMALESDLESRRLMVERLRAMVQGQMADLRQGSTDSVDVEFQTTQLLREQSVLDRISDRIMELQTEQNAPQRVRLRERAERPSNPVPSRTPFYAAFAGLLALAFPFGIGVLLEMRQPKVYTVSQLHATTSLPVIEEVPLLETPFRSGSQTSLGFHGELFQEKVGALCTQLLLTEPLRDARIFLISSPGRGEGKTTMGIAIASELVRMLGEKVLLIDGCITNGRVHRMMGLEESSGLGEVLAFQKEIHDVIQPIQEIPGLHVLPAGSVDISPYSLLGDGRFSELLKELSGNFSRMIIDAPPVLSHGETLLMSSSVDSVLLSVMSCRTIAKELPLTIDKLNRSSSPVSGIVYIGSSMESSPSQKAVAT